MTDFGGILKTCTGCGKAKPASAFNKASRTKDGLTTRCRECWAEYRRSRRDYFKNYRARYHEKNRDRLTAQRNAWEAANAETIRERHRRYQAKNKEHILQKRREWAASNPEKVIASRAKVYREHAEKHREKNRRHYAANKSDYRARDRKRRAAEINAAGSHTAKDIDDLFSKQLGLCAVPPCRKPLVTQGREKFHIDHLVPLIRGGSDDPYNLALMCPRCNRSKGTKTMDEYLAIIAHTAA